MQVPKEFGGQVGYAVNLDDYVNETPYVKNPSLAKEQMTDAMFKDWEYFYRTVNLGLARYQPNFALDYRFVNLMVLELGVVPGQLIYDWIKYINQSDLHLEVFRNIIGTFGRYYQHGFNSQAPQVREMLNQLENLPVIVEVDKEVARLENARKQTQAFVDELSAVDDGKFIRDHEKAALAVLTKFTSYCTKTMNPDPDDFYTREALVKERFEGEFWDDINCDEPEAAGSKHKSTFDIKATRIKNRKLNKLARKARRK